MNKSLVRIAAARTFIVLFVLVPAAGAQTYSVLTSFDATNGLNPYATPHTDKLGNVFGTTSNGGNPNCGVVYELVNNGGGSYTNETLYNFTGEDDGCIPSGGVVMDSEGNLYGTTETDGGYSYGEVYELVNHGGSYTLEVIHATTKGRDGIGPMGDLVMFKGSLYGVTMQGGGAPCHAGGCGTVYRLTKSGGKWVETVLHKFNYRGDGYYPLAGVNLDSDGNIYGTTERGGGFGKGTVFRLSSGTYKETILYSFHGEADGCYPWSGVVRDSAGNLYGTAAGCPGNAGTVYQLKRSGRKYEFSVILTFDRSNGEDPIEQAGHLGLDSAGNVYGTAYGGGAYGYGTVFKLDAGSFIYTDLHDFNKNGTDGYWPQGGVSMDSRGNLYGTTLNGGSNGDGTVWQIANP
jgi:uncharacterized repeat protein (TIGR03803 family)